MRERAAGAAAIDSAAPMPSAATLRSYHDADIAT